MILRLINSHQNGSWQIHGIAQGVLTTNQTVNSKFYCEVLKWLNMAICNKCPEKCKKNKVSPPFLCTCSCITHYPAIPDSKNHYSDSTCPVHLTLPLLLFPVSQDVIMPDRVSL